jgi:aldose 1-epimerase
MAHVLHNDTWRVTVLPETAGSLASAHICVGGVWCDFMRPTAPDQQHDPLACASYLLSPWSNRIRDAQFRFEGVAYQLRPSFPDGTAIHGAARHFPWQVVQASDTRIELLFDSRQHEQVNFPFAFQTWVEYVLDGREFRTRMGVKNLDARPMPAGFGTHPMIQRTLTSPSDALMLRLPFHTAYPLRNCLPTGAPVAVDERLDYRQLRMAGQVFVDDCLTGREAGATVEFVYAESGTRIVHAMDEVYTHLVVYMPVGESFIAVEPVTNANDGFNLRDQGHDGHGVVVLDPGAQVEAWSGYAVQ